MGAERGAGVVMDVKPANEAAAVVSRYSCGVFNCGNGECIDRLIDERCPICGEKMVEVVMTGFKFCSSHALVCDYEIDQGRR